MQQNRTKPLTERQLVEEIITRLAAAHGRARRCCFDPVATTRPAVHLSGEKNPDYNKVQQENMLPNLAAHATVMPAHRQRKLLVTLHAPRRVRLPLPQNLNPANDVSKTTWVKFTNKPIRGPNPACL
jgi:hypothetical protein